MQEKAEQQIQLGRCFSMFLTFIDSSAGSVVGCWVEIRPDNVKEFLCEHVKTMLEPQGQLRGTTYQLTKKKERPKQATTDQPTNEPSKQASKQPTEQTNKQRNKQTNKHNKQRKSPRRNKRPPIAGPSPRKKKKVHL